MILAVGEVPEAADWQQLGPGHEPGAGCRRVILQQEVHGRLRTGNRREQARGHLRRGETRWRTGPRSASSSWTPGSSCAPEQLKDSDPDEHPEDFVEAFGLAQRDDSRDWFMMLGG